ncbi:MAG: hypothetical protein V7744_20690 [Pseudomonadales bacterium]
MNPELRGFWGMPHPQGLDRYRQLLDNPSITSLKWTKCYYNYGLEKRGYLHLFDPSLTGGKIAGDITPGYSTLRETGVRYARDVVGSETPIFFIIRNPVERSWSAAKMIFRYRNTPITEKTLPSLIDLLGQPIIRAYCDYSKALRFWGKYFRHVHVLSYNDLCNEPNVFLEQIANIINIVNNWNETILRQKVWSDKNNMVIPNKVRAFLNDEYMNEINDLATVVDKSLINSWQDDPQHLKPIVPVG